MFQGEKGRRGRGKACQRGPPGIPGLRGLDVIKHLHTNNSILHPNRILSVHKHFHFLVIHAAFFMQGGEGSSGIKGEKGDPGLSVCGQQYLLSNIYLLIWISVCRNICFFCSGGGSKRFCDKRGG